MATDAAVLTNCPNCGAKLKRPDLSLCAYCAMPLAMGGRAAVADDETTQRL
jgi:predicted amidophosphoribosyltransferase